MAEEKKDSIEQGFNDAELEDIMNEIESLEKDFDMGASNSDVIDPIAEEMKENMPVMEDITDDIVAEDISELMDEDIDEMNGEHDADIIAEASEMLDETPNKSIEDELEKAFEEEFEVSDLGHPEVLAVDDSEVEKTDLQDVIDQEVNELLKDRETENETDFDVTADADNVVEMSKPANCYHAPLNLKEESKMEKPYNDYDKAPAETQMSFSMSGNATIKLNFEFKGQHITLHVNEEDGFIIEMAGGVKFSVPLYDEAEYKKAG